MTRVLPLDTKLCTQLFRIAFSPDPVAVAFHVPGPPSMGRFIAAIEARAPVARGQGLREAYADFLKLVSPLPETEPL